MDAALFNGESTDRWPDKIEVFLDLHKLEHDLIQQEFEKISEKTTLEFKPASEFFPEAEKVVASALEIIEQYDEQAKAETNQRIEAFKKEFPEFFK